MNMTRSFNFFVPGLMCLALFSGCYSVPPRVETRMTPMQRSAMQTKELPGTYQAAFRATISVLQDHGWSIDVVDMESGIIQASSTRRKEVVGPEDDYRADTDPLIEKTRRKLSRFKGSKKVASPMWTRWDKVTVHIEPWGENTVRERVTVVRAGSLPSGFYYYPCPKAFGYGKKKVRITGHEQEVVVEDPQTYQALFQQIRKAIFVREALTRSSSSSLPGDGVPGGEGIAGPLPAAGG